jgi:tRNA(Ile)-lysidine synthase
MLYQFLAFGKKQKLYHSRDNYLLAVSGGVDSVVMAHLFKESGFSFSMAHCNFSLRGAESDADEKFVRALAKELKVPCFVKRFETKNYSKSKKIGIQEAARKLRYEWFEELRKEHRFSFLCTAHHRDDSIETFFINLLRGTGLAGLTGVPVKNKRIIRPLLFALKSELIHYAEERRLRYREDRSNNGDDYLRNRLRHQLVPLFEGISPAFRQTMVGNMARLRDVKEAMETIVSNRKPEILHRNAIGWQILLRDLKGLTPLRFWLHILLLEFEFSETVIGNICEGLNKKPFSGKRFYSPAFELVVERDRLRITKIRKNNRQQEGLDIAKTEAAYTSPVPLRVEFLKIIKSFRIPKEASFACLDSSNLLFPLQLRKWKTGDRFQPLGMKGSKLLSDFMTDNKAPSSWKKDTWVLESNGKIAWVLGYRIDDRFKVTPQTTEAVLLRLG